MTAEEKARELVAQLDAADLAHRSGPLPEAEVQRLIAQALKSEREAGFREGVEAAGQDIKKAYEILDKLSAHPCESSVYTLTDDEFGNICWARDMLFIALHEPPIRDLLKEKR